MTEIEVIYEGDLHTRCIHLPTGQQIATDAPVDNHGRGETFSPTDLLGTALGSCIITIMGVYAQQHGIDLKGTRVRVLKEMTKPPAPREPTYSVTVFCPHNLPEDQQKRLERVAVQCPVHRSLRESAVKEIIFNWGS